MTQPTLLLLAAGIGSRYGGLKQIDSVGPSGETIMDYSVYDALRAGFGKLVFVIRKAMEDEFREVLSNKFGCHVPVEFVYQEMDALPEGFTVPDDRQKPWGTGHAIMVAGRAIHEPFAAINTDDFYGAHSFNVLADRLRKVADTDRGEYCMVGYTLRQTLSEYGTVARGICHGDENGYLKDVVERTKIEKVNGGARYYDEDGNARELTGDEIVSLNLWGFTPSIFGHLERLFAQFLREHGNNPKAEFFIPTVVNTVMHEGNARVKILPTPDSWFGITYRKDKERVVEKIRQLVEDGVYPPDLWANGSPAGAG